MSWSVVFYNDRVESEIAKMSPGFVARFVRYAERMEIYGPGLGMPHTKAMAYSSFASKQAKELPRVFFCTRIGRRIVMLHHFIKKTDKTPAKELSIARTRMKEIQNGTHT